MKIKEIRGLGKEELISRLEELRKELIKHNAQIATGTVPKSPGQVKQNKKTIAKILTILNEKKSKEKSFESQKEKLSEKKNKEA